MEMSIIDLRLRDIDQRRDLYRIDIIILIHIIPNLVQSLWLASRIKSRTQDPFLLRANLINQIIDVKYETDYICNNYLSIG
jgi:hypothetical protein